jgi:MFS family permease
MAAGERPLAAPAVGRGRLARVMVIAGAVLVIAHMHRTGGGVITPELHARLGFSGAELGLIMGAMFFGSALIQLPLGLAFDRFGTRLTISTTAIAAIAGTLVFALSGSLAGLIVGRLLIGMGFAGVVTALLLLAMRWAPPERFSSVAATSLALASGVGSVLATMPLAALLAGLGWTPTFLLIAGGSALVALLVFTLVWDAPHARRVAAPGESLGESLASFRVMLRDPDLARVLVMGITTIAPFMCVGGLWAGPYLRDMHGFGSTGMSAVLLSLAVVFHLATLAYGPLDRIFATRKGVVLAGAGITTAGLAGLALVPDLALWPALALLHLVAIGAPFYVTLTAHCRGFVADGRAGRAITLLNLVALVGAFMAQGLTGLIMSALAGGDGLGSAEGYRAVFGFVALLLLASSWSYARAADRPPPPRESDRP